LLNENKVKMMTKMAIYEKNEGKKMVRTARYFKGDYIAFGVLKTLITTSVAYIIMVILFALLNLENIVKDINTLDYAVIGKRMILFYVLLIIVFSAISIVVYSREYDQSRKGLKRYFSRLNKLERFYNGNRKNK